MVRAVVLWPRLECSGHILRGAVDRPDSIHSTRASSRETTPTSSYSPPAFGTYLRHEQSAWLQLVHGPLFPRIGHIYADLDTACTITRRRTLWERMEWSLKEYHTALNTCACAEDSIFEENALHQLCQLNLPSSTIARLSLRKTLEEYLQSDIRRLRIIGDISGCTKLPLQDN